MAILSLSKLLHDHLLDGITAQLLAGILVIPALYIVFNEVVRQKSRIPTLKGPPGLPLIGNLHQIRTNAAEQYRSWSKTYGGVYQIQLGSIPIVVVNTAAAAKVIFGQNAQALNSRPEFYTFHKVKNPQSRLLNMLKYLPRYSQIQLEPQSGRLHIVILSRDGERERHQPSIDLQFRRISLTSMLRPRTFATSY